MPEWIKKLGRWARGGVEAYGFLTSEFVRVLAWPALSTAVYAVLAVAQQWDLSTVYLGAVIVFAATAHALFYIDERRAKHSIANKLRLAAPRVFRGATRQPDNTFVLDNIQFGVDVHNASSGPISLVGDSTDAAIIKRSQGRVERITPAEIFTPTAPVPVGPGAIVTVRTKSISIGSASSAPIEGVYSYRIKYGRMGQEKYILEGTIGMQGKFDPATGNIIDLVWDLENRPVVR